MASRLVYLAQRIGSSVATQLGVAARRTALTVLYMSCAPAEPGR